MYLECVATRDNVDLLYHIAGKIKTVRDGSINIDAEPDTVEDVDMDGKTEAERKAEEVSRRNRRAAKLNSVSLLSLCVYPSIMIRTSTR